MRTIAVINQKGGSGKTTSAVNLAAVFAKRGDRTLLIDMDPQSHCALALAVPEQQIELHTGDVLLAPEDRPLDAKRLFWKINKHLDLIPSTTKLAGLEAARGGLADREDRDIRLASLLRRLDDQYDWCLIDCPPSIGLLTFNALRAASEILVPVETGYFAMRGAIKQVATIRALSRRFGRAPAYRVLPTMHDETSTLSCDVLAELNRRFEGCVLPVVIRFDVRLKEAASLGSPVVDYAPRSHGSADYSALASFLTENPAAEVPLTEPDASEHIDGFSSRSRGVVSIDLFDEESQPAPAGQAAVAGTPVAAAGAPAIRPAPEPSASPISRAAELAARARRLLQRSEEFTERLNADPNVAKILREQQPEPVPVVHTTPISASSLQFVPEAAAPMPAGLLPILGVRQTAQGVVFIYPLALGPKVAIAGDHNGWSSDVTPLRFNPAQGVHEACLRLAPGKFKYRLVVAGRWITDPFNPVTEPNPFGEEDSVFEVRSEAEFASGYVAPGATLAPAPTLAPGISAAVSSVRYAASA